MPAFLSAPLRRSTVTGLSSITTTRADIALGRVCNILAEALAETPLQRALGVAPDKATVAAARPEQEFFMFRMADLLLGVPSANVREVTRMGPMTPLPRMVSAVMGVIGHRGEELPIAALLPFFGVSELKPTPPAPPPLTPPPTRPPHL